MSPHHVGPPDELVDFSDRGKPREVGELPRKRFLIGLEKPLVRLLNVVMVGISVFRVLACQKGWRYSDHPRHFRENVDAPGSCIKVTTRSSNRRNKAKMGPTRKHAQKTHSSIYLLLCVEMTLYPPAVATLTVSLVRDIS